MGDAQQSESKSDRGVAESREGAEDVSRRRQIISGSNAVVLVLAAVGIAIVANAIVSQVSSLRADLTESNIYTLSEASREAVSELDGPVQVKAFISSDMPSPHHTLRKRVKALLTEYRAASGGQMDVRVIAPGDSKETEKAARGFGCEKVGVGQRGEDKVSLRAVFKCVAFIRGEETEVIKDLETGRGPGSARSNFEYEFTKALMNLQNRDPRKIGFVKGFGGPADQRQFLKQIEPAFQKLFGDLIKPTKVDLSGSDPSVPDDISALVLLNPRKKVPDSAKFAVDQFLQKGGSVGWFQSATGVDKKMQRKLARKIGRNKQLPWRTPLKPGLRSFFTEYGIELRRDLVLDRENALAMGMVMTNQGPARISHPATFTMSDIDQSLPFTRDFGTLALPAPSSIDIETEIREREDVEVFEVVETADSAVRRAEVPKTLKYNQFREPTEDEEPGPFVVAAALQGALPSYFADHSPPEGVSESEVETETSSSARLLVVGSGTFYRPNKQLGYNRRLASMGGQFFVSSLEWLAQDSALTEIRGKSMPALVGDVPDSVKRRVQFINIAGVPALFALIGIGMMYRRRKRRDDLRW